jgi:hypothetical protein
MIKAKTRKMKALLIPWCGYYRTAKFKEFRIKGFAEGDKMDTDLIPCTITYSLPLPKKPITRRSPNRPS